MSVISSNIHVEKIDSYTGHRDAVYGLTPTSVDTEFLSCAGDGYVVRWNSLVPDLGTPVAKVTNSIYALHYDSLTSYLWIGHNFDGVHVLHFDEKREIGRTALGKVAIFDIQCAGSFAIIGDSSGHLTWLDRFTGKLIQRKKVSEKSIRTMAILDDEKKIAVGCSDSVVYVLDVNSGQECYKLQGHTNSVFSVQYLERENRLVTAGRDAQLVLWELNGSSGRLITSIPAHLYTINSLALSSSGRWLASGSLDKSVKIWDMQTLNLVKVIDKGRHAGHGTSVNKVMWHREDILLSASDDRTISQWKIDFSRLKDRILR